jgi:hypothetical protein
MTNFELIVGGALPPGWSGEMVLMLRGPGGVRLEIGWDELNQAVGVRGLVELIKRRVAACDVEMWGK